jgi:hypothetical protein
MTFRSTTLGVLAVAIAFCGAYAIGGAGGERSVAQATPATAIAVSRDLAPLPLLAPHEAAPPLARPVRRRRAKRHARVAPAARERRTVPERQAMPEPRATPVARAPLPQAPAPQRKPRPDRSYDEDDYEPAPPQVTPVPTAIPRSEPDPEEEVPEDGTPE